MLNYLSDAAGFIINKETEVRGTVEVWSKEPVTKDEAVDLLNSVLKKNGYAVTRNGRILTIVSLETAKTADLEIVTGNKWEDVEKSDEVVTQIIPVRYASASQLVNNLQVLLPTTATLTVNESANSMILVATKRDVRRMLKIVAALDGSIANISSIKVFQLHYADAKQVANEIQQLFTPQSSQGGGGISGRAQLFSMFRGGGFGGPGGPGGPGGSSGTSGNGANAAGTRVVATSDDYSNSLIVSAAEDLMKTITDMVQQLDVPTSDVTELRVFTLAHADPVELADQISQLFPSDTRSGSDPNQGFGGGFRFFGGRGGRAGGTSDTTSSERIKKKSQVIAVADPRTSSLLVSAAGELMPQLAAMIEQLDASAAKKEVVKVFDLRNADPQDVNQVLQDLFNKNNTMRASSTSSRSMLGNNNPLTQRETQTITTSPTLNTGTTGTGGSRGGGGF